MWSVLSNNPIPSHNQKRSHVLRGIMHDQSVLFESLLINFCYIYAPSNLIFFKLTNKTRAKSNRFSWSCFLHANENVTLHQYGIVFVFFMLNRWNAKNKQLSPFFTRWWRKVSNYVFIYSAETQLKCWPSNWALNLDAADPSEGRSKSKHSVRTLSSVHTWIIKSKPCCFKRYFTVKMYLQKVC